MAKLSYVQKQAEQAVEAFLANERNRLHQSKCNKIFVETCGDRKSRKPIRRVFARRFIREAAAYFAAGDFKTARRFFNGAHQFGGQQKHGGVSVQRTRLLQSSVRLAVQLHQAGDHSGVWNLMEAVRRYAPTEMNAASVLETFERAGIPVDRLAQPPAIAMMRTFPVPVPA